MSDEVNFWDGVKTISGKKLSPTEKLKFCEDLTQALVTSPELAKIFFNTQVYNEIVNDVTTRGAHSEGVAIVAENLAIRKARFDGKGELDAKISGLLARALGYMHDLGHTPFGHDGEGALGNEMERFTVTKEYKDKRVALYGEEYTKQAGDEKAETMCYEHNETSATIGSQLVINFAKQNGYVLDEQAIQYIKTGILAHSTSRVEEEPQGVEQKAVRLADKVAYIPQDLLDLLKQSVITIDALTPEEQSLLGLNEDVLTQNEEAMLATLATEEDRREYLDERTQSKVQLKEKLRYIDKMPESIKLSLFRQLDVKVAEMQAEIASKCFVQDENGSMQLNGMKSKVDFFDKAVNKGEIPENHEITVEEMQGIALFKKMRDAQKHRVQVDTKINNNGDQVPDYRSMEELGMSEQEQNDAIEQSAKQYSQFLQETYGMDPTMATLWVTKAKYQDAFINGELKRESRDEQGIAQQETLADINRRNDNGWKMKTTFQFFYSNIEQIPQEFRDKYQEAEKDLYTNQQLVSAFIASFTNNGLNELYNGLLDRGLVISRNEAIAQLQQVRPDLDVLSIAEKDIKWQDPQKPNETHKVLANDVLEFLYEENVGNGIVSGKNQIPERNIPQIQHAIAVRDIINAGRNKQLSEVPLLSSAIDISKQEVSSRDIQRMVKDIRDRQNSQEIQKHIEEVEKDEGR